MFLSKYSAGFRTNKAGYPYKTLAFAIQYMSCIGMHVKPSLQTVLAPELEMSDP
jgi:hypothetical protein